MVTHDTDVGSGHNNDDAGHKHQIRMANTTLSNPASYDAYLKFNVSDSIEIPDGMKILKARVKVSTTANLGPDKPDFVVLHVANDEWNEDATIPVEAAPDVGVVYTDTLDRTSFTGGNASFLSLDVTRALLKEMSEGDGFMTIRIDNMAESYYAAGAKDITTVTDPTSWEYGWDPPRLHVYYGYEPDSMFSDIADLGNAKNYMTRINSGDDKRLWYNEIGPWKVVSDEGEPRFYLSERGAPYKPATETDASPGAYAVFDLQAYGDFDISLEAKVNMTDDQGALKNKTDFIMVFGFTNPDNYAYIQFQAGDEGSFYTVTDASKLQVGTPNGTPAITDTAYHTYRLTRAGSSLTAYIDGVEYLTAEDASLAAQGKIGMGSYNDMVFFDELSTGGGEPGIARGMEITPISMYPNPAGYSVHIDAAGRISALVVYDMAGRVLLEQEGIGTSSSDLDLAGLDAGIYLIGIITEGGSVATRKLLIDRP